MLSKNILKIAGMPLLALSLAVPSHAALAQMNQAQLGVYEGAGCTGRNDGLPGFISWFGSQPERVIDFLAANNWTVFTQGDLTWDLACWSKTNYRLTLSVPMLINDRSTTLAIGATGAYNQYFKQLATQLVNYGYGNIVIRLGWEFNGGWYRWAAKSDPTSWIAYWRQIVTTMRSVPGAHFKFDWTSAMGWQQIPQPQVYPGDDVVDIIGMDVYNQTWDPKSTTPELRWTQYLTEPYGLNWLVQFASDHHKPISIPEWGTGTRPDGHGGGDDPFFVNNMAIFIKTHNVLYHDYWDYHASDYNAKLSNGQFPMSATAFISQFQVQ